ncbi:MAG: SDR family NAD(P)-dependent oxidoreductase [Verrucomicrobia bacterium]|nr:SDR family NAD(P)-dependent oxidoreductase [Verrucomicrobiota bacterium]
MNTNPIALVTGANRGLGLEVCRQLAMHGYTVILSGRDFEKVTQAAQELSSATQTVHPLALETGSHDSVMEAAETIARKFGRLDVLVNNAGGNFDTDSLTTTVAMDYVRETLEMNLIGAWRVIQAMLPLLRKSSHARIVNVSSGAGAFESEIGFGLTKMGGAAPAYSISKTALTALTVKLASELKDSGILINAVCPGWTATYPGGEAQGARPVAEGAASIVWAAMLPGDGPSGGFFRDGEKLSW